MKFHHQPAPAGSGTGRTTGHGTSQLWLMLPGAYMKPADFIEAGFVEAVHRRGLPHDIALLEANIVEVADGSALRLLQDFLRDEATVPARRIWLLGISLGAHLALACLARSDAGPAQARAASRVAGACLLAPYLGPREIAAEVAAAGSLQQWQPAALAPDDIDRQIWQWLQRRPVADSHPPTDAGDFRFEGELHLGYGSEDRFARAHALMAQALPADRIDVQPGGHAWPVWTALWNRHLDRAHVPH